MYQAYDSWPNISDVAFKKKCEKIHYKGIKHIVFAGMGGSGHISDVFYSIFSKTKIYVDVVKGYHLPHTVDNNTLVIPISISGNTVETLSILRDAKKKKCKIVAFSSGGKIKEFCRKNKIEHRSVPFIHTPRASFAGTLYTMLNVLEPILPINKKEIIRSIETLKKINKKIATSNLSNSNPSLNLAYWIKKSPLIYYPWGLESPSIRFKNSLQENAKLHVITEDIIESCHNGIVAWEKNSTIQPILIQGEKDYIKTKERWRVIKKYFKKNKIDYWEINSVKGDILSKMVSLIYQLDYTSIYKAILTKTDPTPIHSINFIKQNIE
ncbi:glucose-6-phosphate isomerase [Nitrosopumilus cobalaminigenes]|uniref:Glucose-6-phosphate isomerase n=2 Tax=Nitrosopumilus cobalaminigenes TaxID=1470066 RepID=A0A7D5R3I6_9ARCH|nr:glucose-6-phosphate isomerase [Nitrosopumilus cobalaminigenes]